MADNKIPVLTEVYQPKAEFKPVRREDPTLGVTPELIARVAAHVKPRLEEEISQSILESLREEIKKDVVKALRSEIEKTQNSIESSTKDFVDKTKADLKTELPRMYQVSADLVHENLLDQFASLQNQASSTLESLLADKLQAASQATAKQIEAHAAALQLSTSARIMQQLNDEMESFKVRSLHEHQAQLSESMRIFQENLLDAHQAQLEQSMGSALQVVNQRILESTQEQEDIMQTLVGSIQQETLAQLKTTLHEEKTEIYDATMAEIKTHFTEELTAQSMQIRNQFLATINADLPAVQEVLKEKVPDQFGEVPVYSPGAGAPRQGQHKGKKPMHFNRNRPHK